MSYCKQCGIELTKENRYGNHMYCKPCYRPIHNKMVTDWYLKHPEKKLERNEKSRIQSKEKHKLNPERYREYARKNYQIHRDEIIERNKDYWYRTIDKRHQKQKEWREANAERHREAASEWYYNHRKHVLTRMKERLETPEGKEARRRVRQSPTYRQKDIIRVNKRKREMGFIPLNTKFENSEAHHVDINNVIYIPEDIHKFIPHSQNNIESMNNINIIAFDFMGASAL